MGVLILAAVVVVNPDGAELSALYDRAALKIGKGVPKAVMFPGGWRAWKLATELLEH